MLWIFIGILLLTFILNEVLFRYAGKNLTYHTTVDKKVVEIGEEIRLTPVVENRKFISVPFLRVDEYYNKALSIEVNSYSLFLLPFQRVKRTYHVHGRKRGIWYIEEASLKIGDFLGFHQVYKEIPLKIPVVVLPEKRPLKEILLPYAGLYGPFSVKRWIIDDPLMIRGIREYTGSESQRQIHWPSSLKHDRLMVKQFDFTAEKSALVYLNLESTRPFWQDPDVDAVEQSIVLARSVMEELTKEKIPFGFSSNGYNPAGRKRGYYYPPGLSRENLRKYNEILGKLGNVISMTLEEGLKALSRNRNAYQTFILVTPKILPEYIRPLREFSRSFGKTVVIVSDPVNLEKLPRSMEVYKGVNLIGNADS